MTKPFTKLTILLLGLMALAHALRAMAGGPVVFVGLEVPLWGSVAALLVCLALALGLWHEMLNSSGEIDAWRRRERERERERPGTRDPATQAPAPADVAPRPAPYVPVQYFMFASDGLSPKAIKSARARYERLMVGFDAGNITDAALRAAREAGAELAIYVEGPGGPTGDRWAPDERERIKAAADSVGIDTRDKGWMTAWDRTGWKTFTFRQLEGFRRQGYRAAEIDNLDRVLGEGVEKRLAFYKEYADLQSAGRLPRLVLKNLSEALLQAVVDAVETGTLPRTMFAEFHISERGSGDRRKQDALSSRIAIRTLPSNDTHHYDAKGEYGLEDALVAVLARAADDRVSVNAASA